MHTQVLGKWLALFLLACLVVSGSATARNNERLEVGQIAYTQLPSEARETLALIRQGGPFPYRKDGVAFFNREHRLPMQGRNYYREYTVPTPHERTRGARRIIAGKGHTGDVATSGEYYYTDDHYQTFRRIRE